MTKCPSSQRTGGGLFRIHTANPDASKKKRELIEGGRMNLDNASQVTLLFLATCCPLFSTPRTIQQRAWSGYELCAKPSILAFGVSSCIMGRLGGLCVLLGNESLLQSLTKCPIYASQSRLIKVQSPGHYQGKGRDVGFSTSRGRRVLRQALFTQRTLAWEGCVDLWITMGS